MDSCVEWRAPGDPTAGFTTGPVDGPDTAAAICDAAEQVYHALTNGNTVTADALTDAELTRLTTLLRDTLMALLDVEQTRNVTTVAVKLYTLLRAVNTDQDVDVVVPA